MQMKNIKISKFKEFKTTDYFEYMSVAYPEELMQLNKEISGDCGYKDICGAKAIKMDVNTMSYEVKNKLYNSIMNHYNIQDYELFILDGMFFISKKNVGFIVSAPSTKGTLVILTDEFNENLSEDERLMETRTMAQALKMQSQDINIRLIIAGGSHDLNNQNRKIYKHAMKFAGFEEIAIPQIKTGILAWSKYPVDERIYDDIIDSMEYIMENHSSLKKDRMNITDSELMIDLLEISNEAQKNPMIKELIKQSVEEVTDLEFKKHLEKLFEL